MARSTDLGTYQMLWDCPNCETPKLLGLTHRCCPNCGTPQDPKRRYFPSDEDKVAVEDHRFSGADKVCPHCEAPNGALCHFCMACGAPLDEAKEAGRRSSQEVASGQGFGADSAKAARDDHRAQRDAKRRPADAEPPKKKGGCLGLGCGGLILVAIVAFVVLFVFKREVALEVTGHTWQRTVDVEIYGPVEKSDWCDQMPRGASELSRSQEKRSTNKVEDGEDCSTKRVDQGDGTFKEQEECKPRYKEEPVYDDKCRFTVDAWSLSRTLKNAGTAQSPLPAWPPVKLARTGDCLGCEREGAKKATYTVNFKQPDGDASSCEASEATWNKLTVGSKWKGKTTLAGGLDCDALEPAR